MSNLNLHISLSRTLRNAVEDPNSDQLNCTPALEVLDEHLDLDASFLILRDNRGVLTVHASTTLKNTPFSGAKFSADHGVLAEADRDTIVGWKPLTLAEYPRDRLWQLLWMTIELGPYVIGHEATIRSIAHADNGNESLGYLILLAPDRGKSRSWTDDDLKGLELVTETIANAVHWRRSYQLAQSVSTEFFRQASMASAEVLLHQLFEPLQRLDLEAALASRPTPDIGTVRDRIRKIRAYGWETARVVKSSLDLIGLREPTMPTAATKVDCEALVRTLTERYRNSAELRQQTIIPRFESPTSLPIAEGALEEILVNLIHNALKYGAKYSKVKITHKHLARATVVDVISTGIEIAPENFERIFDVGFRTPEAVQTQFSASGFGLHIARQKASRYGGSLYLLACDKESHSQNYRSTFRLEFRRR